MKFKFNDIANAISVISGVSLAGIIGVGSYVYLNKDAIIDDNTIRKKIIDDRDATRGFREWPPKRR